MPVEGSFSYLNDNEYCFPIGDSIRGRISRLGDQLATITFLQDTVNEHGITISTAVIPPPPFVTVQDTTLNAPATMLPPFNIMLIWTSNYEISVNGTPLLILKMQRQYCLRVV